MDWRAFVSTLGGLLLAELGDKTQLVVIAQTYKHGDPYAKRSEGLPAVTEAPSSATIGRRRGI